MNNFLPKDYEENENINETGGFYMKFEQGENRFRVLSSPIVGWEWWETTKEGGRRPKRVRIDEKIDIGTVEDPDSIKRFWAMPVWNYQTKRVEILEITQKTIQGMLKTLSRNEEWGSPLNYDVSVIRKGEGLSTEYEIVPQPPKPLTKEIEKEFKEKTINLEALYDGEDPFTESFDIPD